MQRECAAKLAEAGTFLLPLFYYPVNFRNTPRIDREVTFLQAS
jgi:hypothetical protein